TNSFSARNNLAPCPTSAKRPGSGSPPTETTLALSTVRKVACASREAPSPPRSATSIRGRRRPVPIHRDSTTSKTREFHRLLPPSSEAAFPLSAGYRVPTTADSSSSGQQSGGD